MGINTVTVDFKWNASHPGAHNTVRVTGEFDGWQCTLMPLKWEQEKACFTARLALPQGFQEGDKLMYKFIVDDVWCVAQDQETCIDADGNTNNILTVPAPGPMIPIPQHAPLHPYVVLPAAAEPFTIPPYHAIDMPNDKGQRVAVAIPNFPPVEVQATSVEALFNKAAPARMNAVRIVPPEPVKNAFQKAAATTSVNSATLAALASPSTASASAHGKKKGGNSKRR